MDPIIYLATHSAYFCRSLSSGFSGATFVNLADSVLILLAATAAVALSIFEATRRSIGSSGVTLVYLALSLTRDLLEIQLGASCSNLGACYLVKFRTLVEGIWLIQILHARGFFSYHGKRSDSTPEETAGLTGQAFLYWLHPVLRQGYRARLKLNQLPEIDEQLSSMKLRGDFSEAWDTTSLRQVLAHFHIKWRLPYALGRCLKGPLLSPIFPRLFLISFTYLQPIFMGIAIRFVNGTSQTFLGENSGLGLLLLAIIVYMGMAVSAAIYQSRVNRLRVMVRGALTGLVHHKFLRLPLQMSRDSSALTLIISDIDSIESVGETFHEIWARIMEVIIGTALLASRIQWLALLPSVVIFACSRMSAYVAKNLDSRQNSWNEATQTRIATTTSALEGIKGLKMMGMEDAVQSHILQLRSKETQTSKSLRWILVAYNSSANALGIISPVLTLILFATSSKRDRCQADDIFTSLALLAMVTHPANMVMTLIPQAISVMSNFDRIQTFIGKPSAQDSRVASHTGGIHQITTVRDITIQFPESLDPILRDISIDLNHGEILVCAGAVGSGKTTLAVAILGEITFTMGSIGVSSKQIAYCAQDPWLPSVTIREAILGELVSPDPDWYDTVIESCGLVPDFDSFVDGDMSLIENNGIKLSGGQRQRIALARAVYSRNKILVLDDPFSALDPGVTDHIAQRLLDPQGLFRKVNATVFLISNSEYISSFADRVMLLQDSRLHLQARSRPRDQKGFPSISAVSKTLLNGPSKIETSLDSKVTRKPRRNDAADELSRRNGGFAVYEYYMNAIDRTNALLLIACTAGFSFSSTFAQYVLKWATESPPDSLSFYMSLYAAVSLIAWVATSGTVWVAQMRVATNSGAFLHAHLLERILMAPLSYFTETNLGVILNRFGQDMNVVDKQLPPTLANFLTQIFKMTMQLVLLLKVRLVMSVTLPICATCVYFIQRIYLRTSRQLRFLELETRALVFTNFLDTARGIVTIRAFGWEGKFKEENIKSLDFSQKPYYLLLCLQCWLKMTMDCIMAILAVILIAVTVLCRDTTTGSDLGLVLNLIILANTTLLRLVQSWTSLETSLGSISRLKSIQDVVRTEGGVGTTFNPGLQWPLRGHLKVNDISAAYSDSSPIALRNVSLTANPGQKIIVVGRTGSGKSTMILSLLQLLRPRQGSILLDDTDIGLLSPRTVRRQGFITVPQDSFTIPTASLRFNLDPYHTSSNKDILWSLQRVNLWGKIHSTSATIANGEKSTNEDIRNLLDLPMSAFLPFSAGQSQLFALSQALLRIRSAAPRKPIIILDEASSSLDSETESILTDILRHDLRDYTVVIIAHRVKGITGAMRNGADAIATMQNGKLQLVSLIESST